MIIDQSYFVGEINIPGTDKPDVQERLTWFIAKYEPVLLRALLGHTLYKAFLAGKGAGEVPGEQRFLDLLNGVEFSTGSRTEYWPGLIQPGEGYGRSLIANYVYYWYMRDQASQTTAVGEAQAGTDGAARVSPALKMVRAWNEMSASIDELFVFLSANMATYPEWDVDVAVVFEPFCHHQPVQSVSEILNIPALFEAVAGKVSAKLNARAQDPFPVYFDYGHYNEVTARLLDKGKSISQKTKRFPLIWLVMDFREIYPVDMDYYCELPEVQIIIATPTKQNSTTPQRMQENFAPRLYPVYQEWKKQMANSGFFHDLDADAIPHEKVDRPFWGGQEQSNGANLFNEFIDAIQIRKLKLFVNPPTPNSFKIFNR